MVRQVQVQQRYPQHWLDLVWSLPLGCLNYFAQEYFLLLPSEGRLPKVLQLEKA